MTSYTVYLVKVQNEGFMLGVLPSPDAFNKRIQIRKKGKKEIGETFRLSNLLNANKLMF
jgi:hypothetical protein